MTAQVHQFLVFKRPARLEDVKLAGELVRSGDLTEEEGLRVMYHAHVDGGGFCRSFEEYRKLDRVVGAIMDLLDAGIRMGERRARGSKP